MGIIWITWNTYVLGLFIIVLYWIDCMKEFDSCFIVSKEKVKAVQFEVINRRRDCL